MLLKLVVDNSQRGFAAVMKQLLRSIAHESGFLQSQTRVSAVDALIVSLEAVQDEASSTGVLAFLDDCSRRFIRKPVKYQDDLDCLDNSASVSSESAPRIVSMLWMPVIEQWPFAYKAEEAGALHVAKWLAKLLALCAAIGEDGALLCRIRDALAKVTDDEACKGIFEGAFKQDTATEVDETHTEAAGSSMESTVAEHYSADSGPTQRVITAEHLTVPAEDENHRGLTKWINKDIDEALEDGDVASLIFCLCSRHPEIRRQAMSSLHKLTAKVEVRCSVVCMRSQLTGRYRRHHILNGSNCVLH